MKQSTFYLKGVVLIIGILVLAIGIILFPWITDMAVEIGDGIAAKITRKLAFLQYTFLVGLYATIVPFFFALYQTLKLLSYIDKNKAFSQLSVKALKVIKYCAIAVSILFLVGGMPIVYLIAELDDAPGLILIGFAITLVPTMIATLAAVLQRLLKEAIDIKSENDLTV